MINTTSLDLFRGCCVREGLVSAVPEPQGLNLLFSIPSFFHGWIIVIPTTRELLKFSHVTSHWSKLLLCPPGFSLASWKRDHSYLNFKWVQYCQPGLSTYCQSRIHLLHLGSADCLFIWLVLNIRISHSFFKSPLDKNKFSFQPGNSVFILLCSTLCNYHYSVHAVVWTSSFCS